MLQRKNLAMAVLMTCAALTGALVTFLNPPATSAQTPELKLAPPLPPGAGIQVPSLAPLAEKVMPAVVRVESRRLVEARNESDRLPFFHYFFQDQPEQPNEPGYKIPRDWGGSGFFIDGNGYILTNQHVVEDAEEIKVRTADELSYPATVVGRDPFLDVALLKISVEKPYPALPLGDSSALQVGEWVLTVGDPVDLGTSISVGVVSGKERALPGQEINTDLAAYIQTDASINRGNSGGPLLNTRGEVVGICTAMIRGREAILSQELVEGIGFAIPINPVKGALDQLVRTGTVRRGYLGLGPKTLDEKSAGYYQVPGGRGVLVQDIYPDLPAAKGGVKAEDVILAVDGRRVVTDTDLVSEISQKVPGDKVELRIWRFDAQTKTGKELTLTITLGSRPVNGRGPEPAPRKEDNPEAQLGFSVIPLDPQLRDRYEQLRNVRGVLISEVDPTSDAFREGLRKGLILLDINGIPTPTVEDFRKAAGEAKTQQVVRVRTMRPEGDEFLYFFRPPAGK